MTNSESEADDSTDSTDPRTRANVDAPISLNTELASEEIRPSSFIVPPSIKNEERWICYRIEEQSDGTKKPPKAPTFGTRNGSKSLFNVDPTSTDHVTTFYGARAFVHRSAEELGTDGADGVGIVFTDADDLVGIDLDYCYDTDSGKIERWARDVVRQLDSYTETSPSGTGLHVLVRGELDHEFQNKHEIGLEMYENDRYFTFTGNHIESTPSEINRGGDTLREIQRAVMPEATSSPGATTSTKSSPSNKTDDSDFIAPEPAKFGSIEEQIVKTAREADEKFGPLFDGQSLENYDNDHSRADYALACKLAYWCAGDIEQMDAIFRESALMRPKWDERRGATTYGGYTLNEACRDNQERYGGNW
jgi:primase-polymerase (primpol)-like protein